MKNHSKFRRTICLTGSAVLLAGILSCVPVKAQAAPFYVGSSYAVDTNALNVRSGPGTNYARRGQLTRNYVVTIQEIQNGWGRIDGGWVDLNYLRGTKDAPSSSSGPNGTVKADILNIRTGPGLNYSTNGQLSKGFKVDILETRNGWGRINSGWVSLDYINGYSGSAGNSGSGNINGSITVNPSQNYNAVVTATKLNIRQGAGTGYARVGHYNNGARITILESRNGWGRTTDGWVSLNYVRTTDSGTGGAVSAGSTVEVTADALRIRAGAGTNYSRVGQLTRGYRVNILEVNNGWGRISEGWISLDYVKLIK